MTPASGFLVNNSSTFSFICSSICSSIGLSTNLSDNLSDVKGLLEMS